MKPTHLSTLHQCQIKLVERGKEKDYFVEEEEETHVMTKMKYIIGQMA